MGKSKYNIEDDYDLKKAQEEFAILQEWARARKEQELTAKKEKESKDGESR